MRRRSEMGQEEEEWRRGFCVLVCVGSFGLMLLAGGMLLAIRCFSFL